MKAGDMDTPRIYVASLTDYNAGTLHGVWIDATQDAADIEAEALEMLKASPEAKRFPIGGPAEEWAIHDYEGFQGIRLEEYESFESVSALANAIEDHGAAFAAWYGIADTAHCTMAENVERFQDAYFGHHDSEAAFAEQWADDIGLLSDSDENPLFNHIDWASYWNEFDTDGWRAVPAGAPDYGVFIFDGNV